jgi:MSHA biogenesis protein MshO
MPPDDEILTKMAKFQSGFTLVEAVMVIVITGIVAAMVAVFIKTPVDAYFDSARRAELTDAADTALRRIGRDVRLALPNSVRPHGVQVAPPGVAAIEFLQTTAGGRYDADAAETCFTTGCTGITAFGGLTPAATAVTLNSDQLVIYNQYNNEGGDCAAATNPSAYCGHNAPVITSAALTFANTVFAPPGGSPGRRFQVVSGPVSYVCAGAGTDAGGNGTGTLRRYWGYPLAAVQAVPPVGGNNALLAEHVSSCGFTYLAGSSERYALVGISLQLTQSNETVSLYYEVHVNNIP